MEFSTVSTELLSSEIKPSEGLKKYFSLVAEDVKNLFVPSDFVETNCPCCTSDKNFVMGVRNGLTYVRCEKCQTAYIAKRPSQAALDHYFAESEARRFWHENIWRQSEGARIEKVLNPLVDWILNFTTQTFKGNAFTIGEVYPDNPGFYRVWEGQSRPVQVRPHYQNFVEQRDIETLESTKKFDVICLFGALDKVESPRKLINWVSEHLQTGGLCFITGILSTGLDSLLLGHRADTMLPPDRLTSFSYEGMLKFIEEFQFEIEEFSTPGELDLQNVAQKISELEGVDKSFFNYLVNTRADDQLTANFQNFLQLNRLSSRARIVLKKR